MFDRLIAIVLFFIPILVFVIIFQNWRSGKKYGFYFLAIFLIVYIILSMNGQYIIANHGGSDWRRDWCPKYLSEGFRGPTGRTKTQLTLPGVAFWPFIFADRLIWHSNDLRTFDKLH